jgi:hypothetical protein
MLNDSNTMGVLQTLKRSDPEMPNPTGAIRFGEIGKHN